MKEYYSNLKKRTQLVLESISKDIDIEKKLNQINAFFFDTVKIKSFGGKNGEEVQHVKSFEETCILMQQHITRNPKELTVLEFYQSLETIKKQLKQQRKNNKKR